MSRHQRENDLWIRCNRCKALRTIPPSDHNGGDHVVGRGRARIAGPFVGVSILLAALSLSVDLIEYQPREEPDRFPIVRSD